MTTDPTPDYTDRHPGVRSIMRHFEFGHLPPELAVISAQVARLATTMVAHLPDDPELVTGLRKLLEAKDCFVRAGRAT